LPYSILTYGRDELRTVAEPVAEVTDAIRRLAKQMLQAMYAANGLGLASEQIGRNEAICVIDVPAEQRKPDDKPVSMPLVMVNPEIVRAEGEQVGQEGCLSFPDIFVDIKRAAEVEVVFTDLTNSRRRVVASGLVSRAIQHEVDHLEGVLLVDRMSVVQKVAAAGKLKRLKKESREMGK
jgi:peptide deformylase